MGNVHELSESSVIIPCAIFADPSWKIAPYAAEEPEEATRPHQYCIQPSAARLSGTIICERKYLPLPCNVKLSSLRMDYVIACHGFRRTQPLLLSSPCYYIVFAIVDSLLLTGCDS